MSLTPEESVATHEELQQGDSLYVSETAVQVVDRMNEEKADKYWSVDYSFKTYPSPSVNDLIEFTECSIGVMARDKYELLAKLGAFMEYQAGVPDGVLNVYFNEENALYRTERVCYNQHTKAFSPVVLN